MALELVTPARARALLALAHPDNRPLSLSLALAYARAMTAGSWQESGRERPIELDARGWLANGQHRLLAVLLADVPVQMTVEAPCSARWHTATSTEPCALTRGHAGEHQRNAMVRFTETTAAREVKA